MKKYLLVLPLFAWLSLFLLIPYFYIFIQSFCKPGDFGSVIYEWNIQNFKKIFTNPLYYTTILKTCYYALIVSFFSCLISLFITYYIVFFISKHKTLFYAFLVLPFWVSYIIRAYTWKIILGQEGILNSILLKLKLIDSPLQQFLYNDFSVILCLVYIFTPFVAIPIYTSMENIPKNYINAAEDLGATSFTIFKKIIFPLALPGIISGATFAFVLSLGDFLSPVLLGGPNTLYVSNIVNNLFGTSNDKPLGSAMSLVILMMVVLLLELSSWYDKKHVGSIYRNKSL